MYKIYMFVLLVNITCFSMIDLYHTNYEIWTKKNKTNEAYMNKDLFSSYLIMCGRPLLIYHTETGL